MIGRTVLRCRVATPKEALCKPKVRSRSPTYISTLISSCDHPPFPWQFVYVAFLSRSISSFLLSPANKKVNLINACFQLLLTLVNRPFSLVPAGVEDRVTATFTRSECVQYRAVSTTWSAKTARSRSNVHLFGFIRIRLEGNSHIFSLLHARGSTFLRTREIFSSNYEATARVTEGGTA